MTLLQQIRERVIAAQLVYEELYEDDDGIVLGLANVLLAIDVRCELQAALKPEGFLTLYWYENGCLRSADWDLSKNLDDQSPETLRFIASVLGISSNEHTS